MKRMFGVVTPIVCPFTLDGEIDFDTFDKMIDFLVEEGINGLYVNGSTGEMNRMTVEERESLAEHAIAKVSGKIDVYVQCGAQNTAQTIELAKHALNHGADGIGAVTPSYMGIKDYEMVEYYCDISKALPDDFPVYLYNIPQCAANDIKPAVVEEILKNCKNVVGIKYSLPNMDRFREYIACGDGNFDVIAGPDRIMLQALTMGCKGAVVGCSQDDPVPYINCYNHYKSGNLEAAEQDNREINELCDIVRAGSDIAYTKAAMVSEGLPLSYPRKPALPLPDDEIKSLLDKLKDYRAKYKR